jgi:hypothetical protein
MQDHLKPALPIAHIHVHDGWARLPFDSEQGVIAQLLDPRIGLLILFATKHWLESIAEDTALGDRLQERCPRHMVPEDEMLWCVRTRYILHRLIRRNNVRVLRCLTWLFGLVPFFGGTHARSLRWVPDPFQTYVADVAEHAGMARMGESDIIARQQLQGIE